MQIIGNIVGSHWLIRGVAIAKAGTIIEAYPRQRRDRLSHLTPIRNISASALQKNYGGRAFAGAYKVEMTAAANIDQMLKRIFAPELYVLDLAIRIQGRNSPLHRPVREMYLINVKAAWPHGLEGNGLH